MVTVAPEMQAMFRLLERVAKTAASVLLRGETGTGKELAAHALHKLSHRSGGPFRPINCATLTPELAASELFGHVKGSFTGAISERAGLFALGNGGTVFLDEIAELSLDIQARLLRVLQERTFVPVGGVTAQSTNIRVLAATHKSLRQEVEQKRFREDLMYRIRVVPLFIPPLSERTGDVEALIWHFIDRFNDRGGRTVDGLTEEAMTLLRGYSWPGNIRELLNVIEYAFAVGEGNAIDASELPPELRGEQLQSKRGGCAEDDERDRIREALRDAGGQRSRAAELLGISRSTLWRRMRELSLL
jgi:transcriptional regulator with PAS, ATPase and Fis domain